MKFVWRQKWKQSLDSGMFIRNEGTEECFFVLFSISSDYSATWGRRKQPKLLEGNWGRGVSTVFNSLLCPRQCHPKVLKVSSLPKAQCPVNTEVKVVPLGSIAWSQPNSLVVPFYSTLSWKKRMQAPLLAWGKKNGTLPLSYARKWFS